MAVITDCIWCGKQVVTSAADHMPTCDRCRWKSGRKPWDEMSLEEKVEDLNKRLGDLAIHHELW